MPTYYFDIDDGTHASRDLEGHQLRGVEDASREAAKALAEMMRNALPASNRKMTVDVRNERDAVVLKLSLALAVERLPDGGR